LRGEQSSARLALRHWAWAPVWLTPLRGHRQLRPAATARHQRALPAVTTAPRPVPTIQADTAAQAAPAVPADPHPITQADPADPHPITRADPAGLVDPRPITQADPADLVDPRPITQADPADPHPITRADPADLVDLVRRGAEIPSVATSTRPRGETERHPGDGVHRRGQGGVDRFHHQAVGG
jgi:hypothetical protein